MSEFPSVEAQELVTKDFLRAELALSRAELREELGILRAELGALESKLTLRIGFAIAASTALMLAAMGLFR